MSNKNKDKEAGNQQPKAANSASETPETKNQPDNTTASGAGTDTDGTGSLQDKMDAKKEEPKTTEEPKVSDALVKIGKSILKSNPAMSVVYVASDGRGFYEQNDANNHARTLKNKTVTPVKK